MADWYEFSIEGKKNLKVNRSGGWLARVTLYVSFSLFRLEYENQNGEDFR